MKISFFLLFTISFFTINSQEGDTLKFDVNYKYSQKFIDSVILNFKLKENDHQLAELKKILLANNQFKGWVRYYQGMANINGRKRNFDSVIYYADKAINQFTIIKKEKPKYEEFLLHTYNAKAYALAQGKRDFNNAVVSYQKAFDLTKKYKFKWKSYLLSGIANAHLNLGNDSLALKYYHLAIKDSLYMTVPRPAISAITWIGNLHKNFGAKDSAFYYYNKALKTAENEEYYRNNASIYGMIGSLHYKYNNLIEAKKNYKKALEADFKYGIGEYKGAIDDNSFFNGFSNIYEGNYKQGIDTLKSIAIRIRSYSALSKKDKELYLNIFKALGYAFNRTNDFENYKVETDSLLSFLSKFHKQQLDEDLQNLETQYQTKEKDASITQLITSKRQQETIIKQQKIIAFGLGGLLLLFAISGVLFWKQRKLKNQYEKENLEQRLLRSQMNPHFIGNAMNTVSALVDKKSDNAIPYINKLSNLFRIVLVNSREEFVSIEDELTTLNSYLELQSNFSNNFDFTLLVDETIDKAEYIIPPMLIQPFVENAIIHGLKPNGQRGKVEISISKNENGLLLCQIDDNGIGYSENKKSKSRKSLSGDIIKERLEILKKKFNVDARCLVIKKDKGTRVELYLPYLLDK